MRGGRAGAAHAPARPSRRLRARRPGRPHAGRRTHAEAARRAAAAAARPGHSLGAPGRPAPPARAHTICCCICCGVATFWRNRPLPLAACTCRACGGAGGRRGAARVGAFRRSSGEQRAARSARARARGAWPRLRGAPPIGGAAAAIGGAGPHLHAARPAAARGRGAGRGHPVATGSGRVRRAGRAGAGGRCIPAPQTHSLAAAAAPGRRAERRAPTDDLHRARFHSTAVALWGLRRLRTAGGEWRRVVALLRRAPRGRA
jgi:hypothetical protein